MAIECEACGRKFYESVVRVCPKKDGEHWICLYCCGKCKRRYRADGGGLFGCRAFDERKAAEKEKEAKGKK